MEFVSFKIILNQRITKLKCDWDTYGMLINNQPYEKYLSGESGYQSLMGENTYHHGISQPSLKERRNYDQERIIAYELCDIFVSVQAYLEQNNIKASKSSTIEKHVNIINLIRNVRLHSNGKLTYEFNFTEKKQKEITNYTLESIKLEFKGYEWQKKLRNGSYIYRRENSIIENILTQIGPKLDDKISFNDSDIYKEETEIL